MKPSMRHIVVLAGSCNMDLVCRLTALPAPGETVLCHDFAAIPGGKGANQATALARLGAEVAMLGAVGGDAYGNELLAGLKSSGVDVSAMQVLADAPTGMAYIEVDAAGENRIVVVPGANSRVDLDLARQYVSLLDEAAYLVMQLEIPLDTVCYLAQEARKRGVTVVLNPAPMPAELPQELLANTGILVPNETELARLTGRPVTPATAEAEGRGVLASGVGSVLVTLGEQGAVWILPSSNETLRFAAHPVAVVDTTAAGDTFIGGLVAALARGEDRRAAGEFASKAAALSVSRAGAQSSIPTIEEVGDAALGVPTLGRCP